MDIFLFVASLAAQGALGAWGVYVTLRPPEAHHHKRHLSLFAIVTVFGILVASAQRYRSNQAEEELRASLDEINRTGKQLADNIRTFVTTGTASTPQEIPSSSSSASPQVRTQHPRTTPQTQPAPSPQPSAPAQSSRDVTESLHELKQLIVGQRWGLSADRLVALSRRIAPFAPARDRGDLITCVLGDPDSTRFAESLVAAFRAAGWKLPGSGYNQAVFSGTPEGVILRLRSKEAKPPGLSEFVITLREAGIEPFGELDDKLPDDEFRIIVGRRPG